MRVVLANAEVVTCAWVAARAAAAKHATDIVVFDVRDRLALADVFLICSAVNERQSAAVAREIEERLSEHGRRVLRREGGRDGSWILLDYGDLVVHLMRPEAREHYALERLWKDCPALNLDVDAAPHGADRDTA